MMGEPLLLLTRDDALAARWSALGVEWSLVRGHALSDLEPWRQQGHRLVLMDVDGLGLPVWSDPDWRERLRSIAVLAGLGRPDDQVGAAALRAGVCGFCHVYAPLETLQLALRVIADGELWVGRSLLSRMLRGLLHGQSEPRSANWYTGLTDRERQVAGLAAMGESNDAIARQLGITPRTVKAHLSAVFEQLGVADRLQLALRVHGVR